MKSCTRLILPLIWVGLLSFAAQAAGKADYSGTWAFRAEKSKNVGMMARMQLTSTIQQTATTLVISDVAVLNGDEIKRETRYDLTGKAAANESYMGEKSQTVSRWVDGKLVTTWTSEGAIAGSKVVRTETRYLSADGAQMMVETARGTNPTVTMVFDKQ